MSETNNGEFMREIRRLCPGIITEKLFATEECLVSADKLYSRVWEEFDINNWKVKSTRKAVFWIEDSDQNFVFLMLNAVPECLEVLDRIGNLSFLKGLVIKNCGLDSIPQTLTGLEDLSYLEIVNDACEEKITEVPDYIIGLEKLEILILHGNDIECLPSCVKNHDNLWWLNVSGSKNFYLYDPLPAYLADFGVLNLSGTRYARTEYEHLEHISLLPKDVDPDLFISFSFDELSVASKISGGLSRRGFANWFAPVSALIGADWREEYREGLRRSKIAVFLFSKKAYASEYVAEEIAIAKKDRHISIMPIIIDDIGDDICREVFGEKPLFLRWNGNIRELVGILSEQIPQVLSRQKKTAKRSAKKTVKKSGVIDFTKETEAMSL